MDTACCFLGCTRAGVAALRLTLHLPRDTDSEVILQAHEECFSSHATSNVMPDDPKEHGRIPRKARCVFCGAALPLVGAHPYCFDLGEHSPPQRFWAHADCMARMLDPKIMREL